jgi:hypothetical protein
LGLQAMIACQHLGVGGATIAVREIRSGIRDPADAPQDRRKCRQRLQIIRCLPAKKATGSGHSAEMNPKAVCPMERRCHTSSGIEASRDELRFIDGAI